MLQIFSQIQLAGTGNVKFTPLGSCEIIKKPNKEDFYQITWLQCISAMKEYESKSLEELRLEDYLANRKFGTAANTGTANSSASQISPWTSNPLM